MDMQNVSSLTIPEGQVRTIHNKDNELLWGRVAYGVKYAGDSFQQTYTGKNLFNGTGWRSVRTSQGFPDPSSSGGTIVSSDSNNIKFNSPSNYTGVESGFIPVSNNQKFVVSFTIVKTCNRLFVTQYDSSQNRVSVLRTITSPGTTTFTASQDGYVTIAFANTSADNGFEFENIQLELGASATPYEPFVGSTSTQITPSPNPDYPQAVQVVTGEQTVTISDGVDSEAFPISLGSTEFCKISNYRDYIYNSGDNWYVHKEAEKTKLAGSGWVLGLAGYPVYYTTSITDYATSNNVPFCAIFSGAANVVGVYGARDLPNNSCAFINVSGDTTPRFYINSSKFANASELNTFLANNDTYIYYALATATETQITDTTLVGQLNAIHEWMTRYGYNATVSGNLPIIIDRTNL